MSKCIQIDRNHYEPFFGFILMRTSKHETFDTIIRKMTFDSRNDLSSCITIAANSIKINMMNTSAT